MEGVTVRITTNSDRKISMFSGHNGQKRALLRPFTVTNGGPMCRNLPLFVFLASLLLFFFVFYIYQAQSTELYNVRDQIVLERNHYIKVKSENIDLKAQLERYRNVEANLKKELQDVHFSHEGSVSNPCMCFTTLTSMKAEMALAKLTVSALRANLTSMLSIMGTLKKPVESLELQLQEKIARTSQKGSPLASVVIVADGANVLDNRGNASLQREKVTRTDNLAFLNVSAANLPNQEAVLPRPVLSEIPEQIIRMTQANNLHVTSTLRNETEDDQLHFFALPIQLKKQPAEVKNNEKLHFPDIEPQVNLGDLAVNKQFSSIQKKDQVKKNTINANDDGKQVIGGEYDNNLLDE
uniref:Uncharacterized protein n=1 Tax=Setaria digitata TaxID=48799 RepID=A0A915Q4X8_9BILA